MSTHVRVLVVSDDVLFREGLHRLLSGVAGFTIVESPDAADVALVESGRDDALTLCQTLAAPVVLVAAPLDDAWARVALCAGACGILGHRTSPDELSRAVREVAGGSVWAPRRLLAASLRQLARADGRLPRTPGPLEIRLSAREREVFRFAAQGLGNKAVATRLGVGEATVKAHMARIFRKLGARGRGELAAMYHGIPLPGDAASDEPQQRRAPLRAKTAPGAS